jgi:hypothetical protein
MITGLDTGGILLFVRLSMGGHTVKSGVERLPVLASVKGGKQAYIVCNLSLPGG